MTSFRRRIGRDLLVSLYAWRLRYEASRARSLSDLIEVALGSRLWVLRIAPMQVRDELLRLLETLEERRPATVLEVGTARGGTLFLFARVAAPDATLVTLDLPGGGPFGGGYPPWRSRLYDTFTTPGQRLHLVQGDSHDPRLASKVADLFGDRGVDFLFIDGDHTYNGVKADFDLYAPMVRPGGLIALHDIAPGDPSQGGEVPEFWRQVRERYRHQEILSSEPVEGFGIGLLFP
jgi:predicted O-methyltransferase YrrM